jgi:CNT family concentrative nucleoside transporter
MQSLQSLLGIAAILGFAWLISEHRRAVAWKHVSIGLAASIVLAALFLKLPPLRALFAWANSAVTAIGDASRAGTSFVFGYLGGGTLPFELKVPDAEFVLAFQALPIVLLMSVLTTLLFYWRVLPPVVCGFSWALERTMGVGGAVGLSTAANIFVGHVEAPLFIRPYLAQLSRGELFIVMTGGMAGIAGTVLVLYTQFLSSSVPDAAGHFIIASVLSAPLAVLVGQIMIPDGRKPTGSLADPELSGGRFEGMGCTHTPVYARGKVCRAATAAWAVPAGSPNGPHTLRMGQHLRIRRVVSGQSGRLGPRHISALYIYM